jgi:4-aminobutyrate aminotransferase/(S)-3-amino-2-methylpropionate transaminase
MTQTTKELLERRAKAVPKGVFNVAQRFAASASGALITDVEGRELIDFAGGIGVNNVGHCHPKVVAAVREQAGKLLHSCFHIVMYEQYVALAERLCAATPGDFPKMAALFNSGAEAVENAVKIARHATGRSGVVAFETGFHGRTLLTMTLTSKVKPYKFGFGPFAPEVYRMPYAYCYRCPLGRTYPDCGVACAEKLREFFINNAAAEHIACLVVEPVTGEGGFITPPPEYFPRLKAICEEHGIVFIADEVQTGVGRTGRMFAMEHWGVEPDLLTTAKSLGGGMPISAVVGRAELMDHPQVGGIGGTYGGNPVCCAAALAVLDVVEQEDLLGRAQTLGDTVRARMEAWRNAHPAIGEVRGLGPMLAMEMVQDPETREPAPELARHVVQHCLSENLVCIACGNHGNVIRLLTPLLMDDETLERGLSIIERGLQTMPGA